MNPKSKTASTGVGARAGRIHENRSTTLSRNLNPKNRLMARSEGSNIVRLPVFVDGVFIGNEFCRISPELRASIRRLATEGRL